MLLTSLDHADHAAALLPGLDQAFAWLRLVADAPPAEGRVDIDGERLFAIAEHKTPQRRAPGDLVWETHHRYADIQYVARGAEAHGWLNAQHAPPVKTPYDADKDAEFYEPPAAPRVPAWFDLTAGHLVIYRPEDVHAPGQAPLAGEPAPTVKLVVKLRLERD